MARCPVCEEIEATGCLCAFDNGTSFLWDGDGSDADPKLLYPIFKADANQLLTCGADGMKATLPTLISNPPACQAYNSTNLSIPNNTATAVTMNSEAYDTDTMHCVDEETEVLTGRGWLTYDQVLETDELLTLNHVTGLSEWQPLTKLHVYEARPRTLTLMEGKNHSSLTTSQHRWPVIRSERRKPGEDRLFATTESLVARDRIPISAECADLPKTAKWDDDFVELVAWFWTEGNFAKKRNGELSNTGVIMQSPSAHPENCERISAALYRLFGPSVDSFGRQGSTHDGVPRWRVDNASRGTLAFGLNAAIGKLLHSVVPEKIVSMLWLRELTRAQLELFIHVSMLGDNSGPHSLGQKSKEAAEAFQIAVLLSGRGSSLRYREGYTKPPGPGRFDGTTVPGMWHATQLRNTVFAPRMAQYKKTFSIKPIAYNGVVWCPETPNQTWMARRRGRVYFTGNSTSSNTARITFTTAGTYTITFNVVFDKNATGDRMAWIRKNGTDLLAYDSKRHGGSDLYVGHSIDVVEAFVATDYVEGVVQQTSGAALLLVNEVLAPTISASYA